MASPDSIPRPDQDNIMKQSFGRFKRLGLSKHQSYGLLALLPTPATFSCIYKKHQHLLKSITTLFRKPGTPLSHLD